MNEGISLWETISKREKNYPILDNDIEVDVAIVGGGITAITAANELIAAGKRVAILEAHQVGGVTTGYSTGNLYVAVQPFYQSIEKKFNLDTARVVAQSRLKAIDYVEKNVREKNISCHFMRRPWYCYFQGEERISMEKEIELLKRLDIDINYTSEMPLAVPFKKAAVMPNQARFNPLQYVISMAAYLHEKGCMIYENTPVTHYEEKDLCFLYTKNGKKVTAKNLFLATHSPIGINHAHFFTAPYRSYVVAVHLKNNQCPEGHFWDLSKKSHIFSAHAYKSDEPELMMLSGSHHKTGQEYYTEKHYKELESELKLCLAIDDIAFKWSAQHYQSADDIPYIGLASKTAKHTFMATGYFADGLTYGTVAGLAIADLILDKIMPFNGVYQANRNTLGASFGFLAKENINVAKQYSKDMPIFAKTDFESIAEGEGKIVEINQEKFGVCRDNNELHMVSAVCTHMKCIVNWNRAEKTWDCPCHGSRFTKQGKVIEGPAMVDLTLKESK